MEVEENVEIESVKEIPPEEAEEKTKENVLGKTLRLLLNLLTHILILFTVFVCLVYACRAKVGLFELHIILGVIGYQFLMCQGVLSLAKFNVWSVYLPRMPRIHVHWVLQLLALASVTAGSVLYILELPSHFKTLHGAFGMVALGVTLLGFLFGIITAISYSVQACGNAAKWFKYIHQGIGITALILSAVSLCLAYEHPDFKLWISWWLGDDNLPVPILMFITLLFTCLVAFEFLFVILCI